MPNDKTDTKFRGFRRPTTTPIPDEVIDELLPVLTGSELKVLLYICRRTFGFKKDSDNISLNQMLRGIVKKDGTRLDYGTGLSRPTLLRALKGLVDKNVIIAERRRSPRKGFQATSYRLNFIDDPLGKKTYLGGSQNLTKPSVKKFNPQQTVVQDTVRQQQPAEKPQTTDTTVIALIKSLTERGITKSSARRLAQKYPGELIEQKIEVFDWLAGNSSPLVGRNPPGYLRKSIEENWAPPKGFKSKAQREAERAARIAREKKWKQQQEQETKEAERRRAKQEQQRREQIIKKCGADTKTWDEVLKLLKPVEELGLDYRMLKESILLPLENETARVVVPHAFHRERLHRHEKIVQQAISKASGTAIETVQFLAASQVLGEGSQG